MPGWHCQLRWVWRLSLELLERPWQMYRLLRRFWITLVSCAFLPLNPVWWTPSPSIISHYELRYLGFMVALRWSQRSFKRCLRSHSSWFGHICGCRLESCQIPCFPGELIFFQGCFWGVERWRLYIDCSWRRRLWTQLLCSQHHRLWRFRSPRCLSFFCQKSATFGR